MPNKPRMPDTVSEAAKPGIKTFGREAEIESAIDVLYKTRMRNLILVGPSGCGKTHLFREIAKRESERFNFLELSISAMVSYGHYVGDFEQKCLEAFSYARRLSEWNGKPTVFFCDEIHLICGAGATDADHMDFANIAKPWLSDGRIILWGATTDREFDASVGRDSALRRRFQIMRLGELCPADRLKAVRAVLGDDAGAAAARRIISETDDLEQAIELSDRLIGRHRRTGAEIDAGLIDSFAEALHAERGDAL